jgi:hypothetical protein
MPRLPKQISNLESTPKSGKKPKSQNAKSIALMPYSATHVSAYIDEMNSSGLISVLRRTVHTAWKIEFPTPNGSAKVQCAIAPEFGVVPHGIDNQIIPILLSLYKAQGAPEDGSVTFTLNELCQHLGGDVGADRYDTIRASLRRLRGAIFEFEQSWKLANGSYASRRTFSYFLTLEQNEIVTGAVKTIVYTGILDKSLVENIQKDATVKLDLSLFLNLSSSQAYGLLRFLEARRVSDQAVLEFDIKALGVFLHMYLGEQKRILISLNVGHKELLEAGYLSEIRIEKRKIYYHFKFKNSPEDKLLIVLLQLKFTRDKATSLIEQYDAASVYSALEILRQQQAIKQIKNPAGYLLTLLQDRAKVEIIPPAPKVQVKKPKPVEEPLFSFAEFSPEQQMEEFMRQRKVLFAKCSDNEIWQLLTIVQNDRSRLPEIYQQAISIRTPAAIREWVLTLLKDV